MKRNKGGEPYNRPTFLSGFPENGFPVGEKESPNIQMWFHFIEDRDSWRPRQLEFPGQIPERKKSHKEKATEIFVSFIGFYLNLCLFIYTMIPPQVRQRMIKDLTYKLSNCQTSHRGKKLSSSNQPMWRGLAEHLEYSVNSSVGNLTRKAKLSNLEGK